jgi:hypothetical protein
MARHHNVGVNQTVCQPSYHHQDQIWNQTIGCTLPITSLGGLSVGRQGALQYRKISEKLFVSASICDYFVVFT